MQLILVTCLMALVFATQTYQANAKDGDNEIDLKLFGEDVIQGWDRCRFSLWQKNRDPENDKYAYVFFAPIPDGEALPAWVSIGDDVLELSEVNLVSAENGMLAPLSLYRSSDGNLKVIMEILDQVRIDEGIEIRDGRLTFLLEEKFPFAIRVKGFNGCPQTTAEVAVDAPVEAMGTGLRLSKEVTYENLASVPPAVMASIADYNDLCDPQNTPGFSSSFVVNDEITLWQVPCNVYNFNASSVFAISWASTPDYAPILSFPVAPSEGLADIVEIINPEVVTSEATVVSTSLDSGSDCGSFSKYELLLAPGETVEFELVEFRQKNNCDGIVSEPSSYPLIYSR